MKEGKRREREEGGREGEREEKIEGDTNKLIFSDLVYDIATNKKFSFVIFS